eukprot:COSAG02_NODE_6004_length_3881_cov_46.869117_3_plen_111_part_00
MILAGGVGGSGILFIGWVAGSRGWCRSKVGTPAKEHNPGRFYMYLGRAARPPARARGERSRCAFAGSTWRARAAARRAVAGHTPGGARGVVRRRLRLFGATGAASVHVLE